MYIGDTNIPDGNPLKLGDVQADKIMLGDTQVWINSVAPSAITDFVMTDNYVGTTLTFTFTPATGIPTPTHDLYQNDVLLVSDVSSGDTITATLQSADYKVKAVNVVTSVDSNVSNAVAYLGMESPIILVAGTPYLAGTDFPAETPLTINCQAGGGGGGRAFAEISGWFPAGGGGASGGNHNVVVTIPLSTPAITPLIGAGGEGATAYGTAGSEGGASSFGSYASATGGDGGKAHNNTRATAGAPNGGYGGAGGWNNLDLAENGETINGNAGGLGGEFSNPLVGAGGGGGASWLAVGGNGNGDGSPGWDGGTAGTLGSGGGGSCGQALGFPISNGLSGGGGEITISW